MVHSINFFGHGGEPATAEFSIEYFAGQVLNWLETKPFEKIYLIGYSLGGYVALYLAINYPDKIAGVITIATKLYWDRSVAKGKLQSCNLTI